MLHTKQSKRVDAQEAIEALEDRVSSLEQDARQIRRDLESMYLRYPPLPEVMTFKRGEHVWFTDGYMAVRGGWFCEFADRDSENVERSGPALIDKWEAIRTPARVMEQAVIADDKVVILGNGAILNREMFDAALRIGSAIYSEADPKGPTVFVNAKGETVAGIMPISILGGSPVKQREPYAP